MNDGRNNKLVKRTTSSLSETPEQGAAIEKNKQGVLAEVLLRPQWKQVNLLGVERQQITLNEDDLQKVAAAKCTGEDMRQFMLNLGIEEYSGGIIPRGILGPRATASVDVDTSDYNRFIWPNIPGIEKIESRPLPESYAEVTHAQIEAGKKLLFQPGWIEMNEDDVGPARVEKHFSVKEMKAKGINNVVFGYILRKGMGMNVEINGIPPFFVNQLGDDCRVDIRPNEFDKHIAPHIQQLS